MIKKLFYLILIAATGVLLWFAFAVWIGLYSIYSFPPTKDHPKGSTLIIHRSEWEPMFNSPQYVAPPRTEQKQGMGWSPSSNRPKAPLNMRTIVELPYIDWAYKKSLEPQKIE